MACARSMPRVPRSSLVRFAAPPDEVAAAAVERLGARPAGDGAYEVAAPPDAQPAIELTLRLTPAAGDSGGGTDGTNVVITSTGEIDIPFFAWWLRPLVRIAHRRARAHAIATLRAALDGRPNPPPPNTVVGLPPVAFSPEQATFLATASAAAAVVSFTAALFG